MSNYKLIIIIASLMVSACASKQPCKDALEEPVSQCRAEAECHPGALALVLGGMGAGANGSNPVQTSRKQCVIDNMAAQARKAGKPVVSTHCMSTADGEDVSTNCQSF